MATATAADTAADLRELLADGEALAADVLGQVPELALARAWAAGDVEFGRVAYCTSGRPGVPESKPTLYVEDGVKWTGPKKVTHKPLKGVLADGGAVPACTEYRKYVKEVSLGKDDRGVEQWKAQPDVPEGTEYRWTTVRITRAEACDLLALRVRLTDKGLAATG